MNILRKNCEKVLPHFCLLATCFMATRTTSVCTKTFRVSTKVTQMILNHIPALRTEVKTDLSTIGFVHGHFVAEKSHNVLNVMCYKNLCLQWRVRSSENSVTTCLSYLKTKRLSFLNTIHTLWGLLLGV